MPGRRHCARGTTDAPAPLGRSPTTRSPAWEPRAGFCFVRPGRRQAAHTELGVPHFSNSDGLIPAVVQDHQSGEVLMVGFMNDDAWQITQIYGFIIFFSRTRKTLWTKGDIRQPARGVLHPLDCDDDTVLVMAQRQGDEVVCHTGERTCFFSAGVPRVTTPEAPARHSEGLAAGRDDQLFARAGFNLP